MEIVMVSIPFFLILSDSFLPFVVPVSLATTGTTTVAAAVAKTGVVADTFYSVTCTKDTGGLHGDHIHAWLLIILFHIILIL